MGGYNYLAMIVEIWNLQIIVSERVKSQILLCEVTNPNQISNYVFFIDSSAELVVNFSHKYLV
jgi:hypothetical protein